MPELGLRVDGLEKGFRPNARVVEPRGLFPCRQFIVPLVHIPTGDAEHVPSTIRDRADRVSVYGLCPYPVEQSDVPAVYAAVHLLTDALYVVLIRGRAVLKVVDAQLRITKHEVVVAQPNGPWQVASRLSVDIGIVERRVGDAVDGLGIVAHTADAVLFEHDTHLLLLPEARHRVVRVAAEVVRGDGPVARVHGHVVVCVPKHCVGLGRASGQHQAETHRSAKGDTILAVHDTVERVRVLQ